MAFTTGTTNVMKGARSGVQKLIKNEIPGLYDVGRHRPAYIFQQFVHLFWCSLFTTKPEVVLKHCPTRWFETIPQAISRALAALLSFNLPSVDQFLQSTENTSSHKLLSCMYLFPYPDQVVDDNYGALSYTHIANDSRYSCHVFNVYISCN